jgi:protochlorophyllide reductase
LKIVAFPLSSTNNGFERRGQLDLKLQRIQSILLLYNRLYNMTASEEVTRAAVSKGTTAALRRLAAGIVAAGIWGTDAAAFQPTGTAAAEGPNWIPKRMRRTKRDKEGVVSKNKKSTEEESPSSDHGSSKNPIQHWIKPAVISKVLIPSLVAVYVAYPIASLLLFRLPEHFSWLGLFQNFHQCWATVHRNWISCIRLYSTHVIMFTPGISALWLWYARKYSKSLKLTISAASLLIGIAVFKLSVDHLWLFHVPKDMVLEGKVAVITGANRGIGFATALALAERGAHVVVTCRSLAKCQPVVDQIEMTTGGSARAAVLDLASLESAAHLAEQLAVDYPEIHYFFANAGTTPQYELTQEGLEDGFGGMHLAHMAVVLGLLPNLQRGGDATFPSRVVVVTSEMSINAAMGIFGNDIMFSTTTTTRSSTTNQTKNLEDDMMDDWRGERTRGDGTIGPSIAAYGRAKLCGVLFAFELNRRLARQGIPTISHAVHTGAVVTDSSRDSILQAFPSWIPGLRWVIGRVYFPVLWRSVQGGARTLLCPALSQAPHIIQGGQYLDALCQPFFHDRDPNISREQESMITIPSFLFGENSERSKAPNTLQVDPVQAVLLADVRFSERLWNVSLAFLENSPARSVVEFAP